MQIKLILSVFEMKISTLKPSIQSINQSDQPTSASSASKFSLFVEQHSRGLLVSHDLKMKIAQSSINYGIKKNQSNENSLESPTYIFASGEKLHEHLLGDHRGVRLRTRWFVWGFAKFSPALKRKRVEFSTEQEMKYEAEKAKTHLSDSHSFRDTFRDHLILSNDLRNFNIH